MAVIEIIKGSNKTYSAMKRVINYIKYPVKTSDHLIGGHNCDANNAYNQFVLTMQIITKKQEGSIFTLLRVLHHMTK